ncbi:MAG: hypothetical protein IJ968_00140, partial [Clostridia bacterium]|nr:hypothetical protein [Clostridia bacterium]
RYFINRFANRVLVLSESGVKEYKGNFDDYQARLAWENARPTEDIRYADMTRTEAGKEKRKQRMAREQKKALKEKVAQAEKNISRLEAAIAAHEERMATAEIYSVPEKAAEAARVYQQLKDELNDAFAAWEEAAEELENAEE